jgi:hypothetical protein
MTTVFWRSPAMARYATLFSRSRRRWWRNEDHGEFLWWRRHVTGAQWHCGEVVGAEGIDGYRGKEGLRTYQGVEGDEVSSVAKSLGSRWSENSTIARQSFVGARVLTGVDELLVPADARAHDDVWEGHLGVGVLEVVARCAGAAGVCRIWRFSPSVTAAKTSSTRSLWWVSGLDQKGRNTAEVEGINMRSLDMAINNDLNGIYRDWIAFTSAVSWQDLGRRRCWQPGPPVSEERREKGIPFRDCFLLGRGLLLIPGRIVSPQPFTLFPFSFLFFFFCFSS